jgi:hypothetical protein
VLLIERAPAKRRSGRLLKNFVNSDFSRPHISAKKRAGVTRCSDATTRRCSGNHRFNQSQWTVTFTHYPSIPMSPPTVTDLLKLEDILRRAGLNFVDAEDADEVEFLLN